MDEAKMYNQHDEKGFQIVELNPERFNLQDSRFFEYLRQVYLTRSEGYKSFHGDNTYPFGLEDRAATNLSLKNNSGSILSVLKCIDLQECDSISVEFPALEILKSNGASNSEVEFLEAFLNKCRKGNLSVNYAGAYTRSPKLTEKQEKRLAMDWVRKCLISYHEDYNYDYTVLLAIKSCNFWKFLEGTGFKSVSDEEFVYSSLSNERGQVSLMIMETPSITAINDVRYLDQLWNERFVWGNESPLRTSINSNSRVVNQMA
jgi:hypothetical protein